MAFPSQATSFKYVQDVNWQNFEALEHLPESNISKMNVSPRLQIMFFNELKN